MLILFPDDYTLAGPCAAKYVPLGVTDYETGNEPNIRNITPAQFLSTNNAAYTAIKKVSASTKVITAGLAPYGKYTRGRQQPRLLPRADVEARETARRPAGLASVSVLAGRVGGGHGCLP